jgi:hypothetical protein
MGTTDSAGTVTAAGVALGVTNAIGVDALLVTSIESVYTGDLARGVNSRHIRTKWKLCVVPCWRLQQLQIHFD